MIDLANLKPSKTINPPRILIYGEPKVGKSSFAAASPNPLFLDIEKGLDNLNVAKVAVENMFDFNNACDAFLKQDHDFKTLVIDSADWLEALIHQDIVEKSKADSITDKSNAATSYGQGYIKAASNLSKVLEKLDNIRLTKRVSIIIIAHALVKKVEMPDTMPFDMFTIKCHEKFTAKITEWCDVIGFAREVVLLDQNKKAVKGDRYLMLDDTKAAVVGNRYSLPSQIPLYWIDFIEAFKQATKGE